MSGPPPLIPQERNLVVYRSRIAGGGWVDLERPHPNPTHLGLAAATGTHDESLRASASQRVHAATSVLHAKHDASVHEDRLNLAPPRPLHRSSALDEVPMVV